MKNAMETAFDEAIELIKIKANEAAKLYFEGKKRVQDYEGFYQHALARERSIKDIATTIEIFTGRRVAVEFINIEHTHYKIIENPYDTNETVLFEWDLLNK